MFPFTPRHETRALFEGDGGAGSNAGDGGHEAGHQAGVDAAAGGWGGDAGTEGGGFESSTPAPTDTTPAPSGMGTTQGTTSTGTAGTGAGDMESSAPSPGTTTGGAGAGGGGGQVGSGVESAPVGGIGSQSGLEAGAGVSSQAGAQAQMSGFAAAGTATGYSPSFTDVIEAFGEPIGPSFEGEDEDRDTMAHEREHDMGVRDVIASGPTTGPESDVIDPLAPGALRPGTQIAQSRALDRPIDTNVPAGPMRPGDVYNRATSIANMITGALMGSAPGPVGAFLQGRPMGVVGSITGPWQAATAPINAILGLGRTAGVIGSDEERGSMRAPVTGPMASINPGLFGSVPESFPELGFRDRPSITGSMLGFHADRMPVGAMPNLDPSTYDIGYTPAEIAAAIASGDFGAGSRPDVSGGYMGDAGGGAMGGGGEGSRMVENMLLSALGLSAPTEEQQTGSGEQPSQQGPTAEQLPELLRMMLTGAGLGFFEDIEKTPSPFMNTSRQLWAA